jgi:speckle-type POZ protein
MGQALAKAEIKPASSALGGSVAPPPPPTQTASSIVAETASGSHVLKIDGYSLIKGLGVNKFIRSATFSVGGRSWQMRFYPDGWDKENADNVSMALFLVDTEGTDAKVRARFSLLDQAQGTHLPVRDEWVHKFPVNTGNGYGKFFERKLLEESTHLRDDSLEIKCDVTVFQEIRVTEAVGVTARFVVVPPSNMHHHFGRLLSSGQGADVTFKVGTKKFAAHRYMLAARSPVFAAELFGPMKEKTATCIAIHDMEATVFKNMLHFIYTDSLPENGDGESCEMAQHLLVAADRYNLERLKLICEEKLCSYIDASTVGTTLTLAEQHGCLGLKEACFSFLKSPDNVKAFVATDGFEHLTSSCPSVLKELVGQLAP